MFKGGFLSGYKTYVVAGLMILTGFVDWAVNGNITLADFITMLSDEQVLGGLGLGFLRAGVSKS